MTRQLQPTAAGSALLTGFLLVATGLSAGAARGSQEAPVADDLASAYAALEAGDLDRAGSAFGGLLEASAEALPAWVGLAMVREAEGDPVEALRLARKARELGPDNPAPALVVARLLARLDQVDAALQAFAEVRRLDPKSFDAYLAPAILLRGLQREQEAVELLRQGIEELPRRPELREQLGLTLLSDNRPEQARTAAEEGLELFPDEAGLHLVLGLAHARDPEQQDRAIEQLERVLELGAPQEARVRLELATLLTEAGRAEESMEHLKAAGRLLPDSPEVHYRLGTALREAGDLEGARSALLRFQELSRKQDEEENLERTVGIALNEAQALAQGGRPWEALGGVDALLEKHPEETRALAFKAKLLYSAGRPEEALQAVEEARRLDPTQVELHFLEGIFNIALERPRPAEEAFERAVALRPELGEAHAALAQLAASRGDSARALAHLQRAFELGVDSPALRKTQAELLAAEADDGKPPGSGGSPAPGDPP